MLSRLPQTLSLLAAAAVLSGCSGQTTDGSTPAVEAGPPPAEADAPPPATKEPEAPPEPEPAAPPEAPVEPTKKETFELTFAGDIIFGRYRDDGFDPIPEPEGFDPFAEIKPKLDADLTVANLETPVIEELSDDSPIGSKYRFGASREHAKLLVSAGIDVVSLANNHFYDLRQEGQRESPRILKDLGIMPIGASREEEPIFFVEGVARDGWKVGFLGVTSRRNAPQFDDAPVLPFLKTTEMDDVLGPIIEEARPDYDVLIVFVHWGDEYAEEPAGYQRRVAHALVDSGADLVVGHHPHVLQGVERYNDGVIAYSMGNFLFENTNAIPRLTGVLRTKFESTEDGACLSEVIFHPAVITRKPSKHPVPATGGLLKRVVSRAMTQARGLDSEFEAIEGSDDLRLANVGCGSN